VITLSGGFNSTSSCVRHVDVGDLSQESQTSIFSTFHLGKKTEAVLENH